MKLNPDVRVHLNIDRICTVRDGFSWVLDLRKVCEYYLEELEKLNCTFSSLTEWNHNLYPSVKPRKLNSEVRNGLVLISISLIIYILDSQYFAFLTIVLFLVGIAFLIGGFGNAPKGS